ncbi:MAG TPA: prepilin-type N-terminal cleavage/methylation domain-containing protein [Sedimentisphaerales bacterium]|nr:prepilin-type N-terminal cleavage/methylation domain-containing protein [Sedimentisphaerales bacterium]
MHNTRYKKRDTKYETGFTIVELLLALAIASILLATVATAFNASIINYRQNEDIFKVINSARQSLFRLTSQLRTADAVDPTSPANECTLITADGDDITYRYNNADNKLYLITNDDLSDPDYVLCDNVTAMTFTKDTVIIESIEKVRSVQVSITVACGNVQRKISAAAVIRRNLSW